MATSFTEGAKPYSEITFVTQYLRELTEEERAKLPHMRMKWHFGLISMGDEHLYITPDNQIVLVLGKLDNK